MSAPKNTGFKLHEAIGTCLYTGYAPVAPGTAGSALCIVFFWIIPEISVIAAAAILAVVLIAGIKSAGALEKEWGNDPGKINIDEFAGMLIGLIGLPKIWWLWLTAFLLFRAFDIFKPPPVKTLEYLPGGLGVMADDVAAGIYTNICCWIILWIL